MWYLVMHIPCSTWRDCGLGRTYSDALMVKHLFMYTEKYYDQKYAVSVECWTMLDNVDNVGHEMLL